MDTEQQIRLNFLDEAEEYFDLMESNLLGLADKAIESQQVDLILRSAHSIKGGAGMMGFNILSRFAHRTEDFLKILRVRYVSQQIETEIETLLLQSLDDLRHLASLHRQGVEIVESDLERRIQPIFDKLQEYLGDLETADETALLAQNEDFDPAVLIFEEGVEGVLDRFETELASGISELSQELVSTAQELIGFGNMASLEPFIQLCESIQQEAASISPTEIKSLAEQALKTWRRSHALVLRGRIEKLPSYLEGYDLISQASIRNQKELDNSETEVAAFDPLDTDAINLSGLQSAFELDDAETEAAAFDPLDTDAINLSGLQSAFELDDAETEEVAFDPLDTDAINLSGLQSAFELDDAETEEVAFDPLDTDAINLSGLQSAFELDDAETEEAVTTIQIAAQNSQIAAAPNQMPSREQVEQMVRVPTSQLKQFNTLFEQLVLNRNSINLRLKQLQNVVALMSQRMSQMEHSNTQLQQWYSRASVEGLLSAKEPLSTAAIVNLTSQKLNKPDAIQDFDSLEMDRYSDLHLICQEQIETIVQLQEVATDIELGVQEVYQSVRDLHYTTTSMQGNVNRTQMLPFADAVKRCPRIIRDLNLQFDKQVKLKIIGEKTLLDRSVIAALSDPLMHLLRNAFDHGIEDSATRSAAGKPEAGTITIQASNQGTYSVITLSDDGGGINLDKIRDRICQMGLPPSEVTQFSDAELLNFIFEPGFSTAQQVTELSGRGVGMDVVRTDLQKVRGDVGVSSVLGQGTTFTLRIPFSLSILRVAIVEQGDIVFAVPANSIRELIACPPETILAPDHDTKITWNQTEIPLIEIEKILLYRRVHHGVSLTGNPTINQTMTLVVGDDNLFVALKINRFWEEQESTIRTIDSPIPLPTGVVSSVIIGDGKAIPLIDPLALIDLSVNIDIPENNTASGLNQTNNSPTVKTILIVDDSINVRRFLGLSLEKAGYRIEQARDGQEAVTKLLGGMVVQAVICDIEMPKLDGYGVLEEIKERPEFSDLPIAMLTSRSNEKHRKLAMNLGASAYFSKPYNEQQLLEKLAEMVNN